MHAVKKKAVVNAEPAHIAEVDELVRAGRYRSVSEFVREAMGEKLERLAQDRVSEQVERYCAFEQASEDDDLIGAQAFDDVRPEHRGKR